MLALLSPRIIIAFAIALALAAACWKSYVSGKRVVQAEWNIERAAQVSAALAASEAARAREQALQANADKLRREKDAQIATLNGTVGRLTKRLQDRPDRPAVNPAAPASSAGGDAKGCTGDFLYRPDGAFLVGEAQRADTIRIALDRCEKAYGEAAGAVNK